MNDGRVETSVVMTCYNYGRYVGAAIESVLSQTYHDYELIVVNDGSTDDTDRVVSRYVEDHGIKYIRQANLGQAGAKNAGIEHSKGDFVAFLDADDIWDKTKLEKQIPLFAAKEVGVVFSRLRCIDEDGVDIDFDLTAGNKHLVPRAGNVSGYLLFDNFVPFSSAAVRRECLDKTGGFDETLRMGIDWDLWLRVSVDYAFDYVAEPLMFYRLGHSGQMSKDTSERFRCADRIMQKFLEQNPGLLPPSLIRRGKAYAFLNRGRYLGGTDRAASNRFFLSALREHPFETGAYVGLLRNLFL